MKKTLAAIAVAATMGLGATPSFAVEIAQISSVGLGTTGFGIASGVAGNFADVNQSAFQVVGAREYASSGFMGSNSGASMFSLTDLQSNSVSVSGAAARTASAFGGTSTASLVNAQFVAY